MVSQFVRHILLHLDLIRIFYSDCGREWEASTRSSYKVTVRGPLLLHITVLSAFEELRPSWQTIPVDAEEFTSHSVDGKTRVTIAYVPQVVAEIVEVVRMIPVDVPVPQICENRQQVTRQVVCPGQRGKSTLRAHHMAVLGQRRTKIHAESSSSGCAGSASDKKSTLRAHQMAVPSQHKKSTLRAHQMAVPGQRRTKNPG